MKTNKNDSKTDRRVAFTKTSIKDTLLEEIKSTPFEEIGIVGLCDKAQISRSAFYLHFANLSDVLEEIVMDAVDAHCEVINIILGEYVVCNCEPCKNPDSSKYVGLFSDKTASEMLMRYLVNNYKTEFVKNISEKHDLSKTDAEIIFYFQTMGIITAAMDMKSKSPKRWIKLGQMRDKIMQSGINGLKE